MLHSQEKIDIEYAHLLTLPQWKARRIEIICRDGNKCRSCGGGNFLQVHHRQYHIIKSTGAYKDPWCYKEKQLITLCSPCHANGHTQYQVPVFIVHH